MWVLVTEAESPGRAVMLLGTGLSPFPSALLLLQYNFKNSNSDEHLSTITLMKSNKLFHRGIPPG